MEGSRRGQEGRRFARSRRQRVESIYEVERQPLKSFKWERGCLTMEVEEVFMKMMGISESQAQKKGLKKRRSRGKRRDGPKRRWAAFDENPQPRQWHQTSEVRMPGGWGPDRKEAPALQSALMVFGKAAERAAGVSSSICRRWARAA